MMKKFISILLLCTLCLVSCGGRDDETSYKNDVAVKTISDKIYETVGNQDLTEADAGWVALNIPIDLSLCEDSDIYISTTGSADLFGVFKATSADNAEKLFEQAEDYLDELEANWMSEYLAEELPKIQNAETVRCGLYVTFLIVDDSVRNTAASAFEDLLIA